MASEAATNHPVPSKWQAPKRTEIGVSRKLYEFAIGELDRVGEHAPLTDEEFLMLKAAKLRHNQSFLSIGVSLYAVVITLYTTIVLPLGNYQTTDSASLGRSSLIFIAFGVSIVAMILILKKRNNYSAAAEAALAIYQNRQEKITAKSDSAKTSFGLFFRRTAPRKNPVQTSFGFFHKAAPATKGPWPSNNGLKSD